MEVAAMRFTGGRTRWIAVTAAAAGGPQNGPADLYAFGLPVPSRPSAGS
jgi:hypothetical protein